MRSPTRLILGFLVLICATVFLGGCATAPVRNRLGGLPFPGLLSLYELGDAGNLGHHRSDAAPLAPFAPYEAQRGIIYTTRGGFVDVAHIRKTIDLTRFLHDKIDHALTHRDTGVSFEGSDRVTYHLAFAYPPTWDAVPEGQRKEVRQQVTRVLAQRVAYGIMTWHEVQTWYGYRNGVVFSEKPSAFAYDDAMSHWVGMEVAGRALKHQQAHPSTSFDSAATEALNDVMQMLGAVSPAETDRAVWAVNGTWWANGEPLLRHVHVGLTSGYLRPWLVPPAAGHPAPVPGRFRVPQLSDLPDPSYAKLLTVDMELHCWEAGQILQRLGQSSNRINLERDLPTLLQAVCTEIHQQYGPAATPVTLPLPASYERASSGRDTRAF